MTEARVYDEVAVGLLAVALGSPLASTSIPLERIVSVIERGGDLEIETIVAGHTVRLGSRMRALAVIAEIEERWAAMTASAPSPGEVTTA